MPIVLFDQILILGCCVSVYDFDFNKRYFGMSKHRLYNSGQESENLNLSRDESNTGTPSSKSKGKENTNRYPYGAQSPDKNTNPTVQPHSFPKPGAAVGNEKTQHGDDNKNVNQFHSGAGSACVSDSDSMDEVDFFSKGNSNVKLPYTLQEDEFIIRYVLKGRNIFRASSVSLWKYLECKKENPKRTYQSLKNRFLKSIKPRLFTTYSYLIKDKETESIILEKYPDLKKRGVRKDVFSALNLPKRPPIMDFSDDEVPHNVPVPPSVARSLSNQNQNSNTINKVDEKKSEQMKTTISDTQNRNRVSDDGFTHSREVTLRKDTTLVTVKFSKSVAKNPSKSPPVGIYAKFLALKNQNKLVPCPTCSRLGFRVNGRGKNPDESDSDSDNDNFIPNSVETPNESNSKTPSGSNRVRRSLPLKELGKSPNNSNSRKSKNSSKEVKNTPKNSNQRDLTKGGKTVSSNSNQRDLTKGGKTVSSNSNPSSSQNNIGSKELKLLFEDSYSRKILNNMPPNKKRKIVSTSQSSNKTQVRTSNSSQQQQQQQQQDISSRLQSPPSRNLRKSVRKLVVKKVSNDVKINNSASRKQPRKNLDTAKPTTTTTAITTVAAEGSGSGPYLGKRAKKSISYSGPLKKPTKKLNVYKLPLRIATLTHRERFILRKILRRTYKIYRRNLLENKKKRSKATKKRNLKKKPINTEQKETNSKSQSESDSLNDNYLRSLYKETVSECRKLVNSDEEGRRPEESEVRYNTRRQNVVNNQSFDDELLKSFFMESDSETLTSSSTHKSKSDLDNTGSSSLADNMMKMLSRI